MQVFDALDQSIVAHPEQIGSISGVGEKGGVGERGEGEFPHSKTPSLFRRGAAVSADGVVVKKNQILLNYHPASQSLGTPPKQGGEFSCPDQS